MPRELQPYIVLIVWLILIAVRIALRIRDVLRDRAVLLRGTQYDGACIALHPCREGWLLRVQWTENGVLHEEKVPGFRKRVRLPYPVRVYRLNGETTLGRPTLCYDLVHCFADVLFAILFAVVCYIYF